jgi:DNA repair exonuclease SbcCD ATPase subunit
MDEAGLSLVLGQNVDQGGNSSRNGAGKTTILNGISYALFGTAITNIRKDNLINKTNGKEMLVTLEFERGKQKYKIERGRKPNTFKFYVNDGIVNSPDTDEAQGENRFTQEEINKVINISPTLFKHIIALNTYTEPFLGMKAGAQREVIEELLGITLLSQKADALREQIRETKDQIKEEEFRIKAVQDNNKRINTMIENMELKSQKWEKEHKRKIEKLEKAIEEMQHVDIDAEIKAHENLSQWKEVDKIIRQLDKEQRNLENNITAYYERLQRYEQDLQEAQEHQCPTCGQEVHDEKHSEIISNLEAKINNVTQEITRLGEELEPVTEGLDEAQRQLGEIGECPEPYYDSAEQAYNHRATIERLQADLEREREQENPELENIQSMRETGLQTINYQPLNELTNHRDHQEFLLKLLTNKDSFIRKKIIDQNLAYLNHQLNHYLEKLALPHEVVFQNDLSVEITELGRDLDFHNLSRGESNRLTLGLSWAFRDLWESLNDTINVMFVDELIDSGMDSQGVESALEVLKKSSRERNRNVFLISHREELMSRVSQVLVVQKENGFTTFSNDFESVEGA